MQHTILKTKKSYITLTCFPSAFGVHMRCKRLRAASSLAGTSGLPCSPVPSLFSVSLHPGALIFIWVNSSCSILNLNLQVSIPVHHLMVLFSQDLDLIRWITSLAKVKRTGCQRTSRRRDVPWDGLIKSDLGSGIGLWNFNPALLQCFPWGCGWMLSGVSRWRRTTWILLGKTASCRNRR